MRYPRGFMAPQEPRNAPYHLFVLALSLTAIVALGVQWIAGASAETRRILIVADSILCIAFLLDFCLTLAAAKSKWKYFATWGWIDLVSSIPVFVVGRWGRLARVARALQWIRAFRVSAVLWRSLIVHKRRSAGFAVILLAFWLVIGGSVAILEFENAPGSNIKNAEDALWWALATVTTVGYGDRFPVTTEGRMVAAVLMLTGVGLFGLLSGTIAGWFLSPEHEALHKPDEKIAAELAELRRAIDALRRETPPRNDTRDTDSAAR